MNRILTILGAGESGVGAALLGKAQGYDVFVSDFGIIAEDFKNELRSAGIEFEENGHSEARILKSNLVVKSPGIPDTAPIVQALRNSGNLIISEIEFAGKFTKAKLIGITGTNGKTTTTMLTYHILKGAGYNVGMAGNVGKSFARQVLTENYDWYVLELSSFQLDDTYELKLEIGVLLNITPDHLDRYDYDFKKYIASKMRIFHLVHLGCHAVYWQDDAHIGEGIASATSGLNVRPFSLSGDAAEITHIQFDRLFYVPFDFEISAPRADISIKGLHNVQNAMAAGNAALLAGVNKEDLLKGLKTFKNAEHRLELVKRLEEVDYINDSKATNLDSVKYALDAFDTPIVWIAGGIDKGNNYSLVEAIVSEKVKALICLGKDNTKLVTSFENIVPTVKSTDDLIKAIRWAKEIAKPGDTVLLSPACSSFDLFDNYEDRGNKFKEAVLNL
ncbi:UDP-N-acetylmuramoyl-L-alanine--D-glutamate ligase [Roseivirga misakiensis]|uniref:UDP-N-acetylmuramoylalanine--D-glutamate ligase n=1 Tax=Roseivirga misakiensis TaxID=1563681 RepID=A0A1E5SKC4_9BACT|nr:UDP-N-acetylmuramoyl-L-alanine--D-glutamate ligase [Roseivirga misakiensis]OEJ99506.1 UDP-N-acetylmuramoylalanine--D-glutamate ligase [Roseivirga misakiensis]